jgi:hypothetical protein
MAIQIQKTLQGVVRITENGNYNLVLPSNGARAQNGLAINNVEEVFLIVENIPNPAIIISLPKILDFNGGWNTKIYVLCKASGNRSDFVNINSYSSETYTDWINQEGNGGISVMLDAFIVGNQSNTAFIHILDNNYWLAR